jgi:hypothetical protein
MSEKSTPPPAQPVVDPSPTQAPIQLGSTEYVFPPAAASPPEVLELKPNRHADAVSGPDPQVSSIGYVHMSKPDGSDFLSPAANVEHYEAKGFVKGASEEIEDIGAYWTAKPARGEHAEAKAKTA